MSNYPSGVPSPDFTKLGITSSPAMSPATVCAGIIDNHSAVNENTMRNSVGYEISLLQNFVNYTYLARDVSPVNSGWITNLVSDYINVSDHIELNDGVNILTVKPSGVRTYAVGTPDYYSDLNKDGLIFYQPDVSGPNDIAWVTRDNGFYHSYQQSSNIAKLSHQEGLTLQKLTDTVVVNDDGITSTSSSPNKTYIISAKTLELASTVGHTDLYGETELGLRSNGYINMVAHGATTEINIDAEGVTSDINITATRAINLDSAGTATVVADGDVHIEALNGELTLQGNAADDAISFTIRADGRQQAWMYNDSTDGHIAWWGGYDETRLGKVGTYTIVHGTLKPDALELDFVTAPSGEFDYLNVFKKLLVEDEINQVAEFEVQRTTVGNFWSTNITGSNIVSAYSGTGGAYNITYGPETITGSRDVEVIAGRDIILDPSNDVTISPSNDLTINATNDISIYASNNINFDSNGDINFDNPFSVSLNPDNKCTYGYNTIIMSDTDGTTTGYTNVSNYFWAYRTISQPTYTLYYSTRVEDDECTGYREYTDIGGGGAGDYTRSYQLKHNELNFISDTTDISIYSDSSNMELKSTNGQVDVVGLSGGISTLGGELYIDARTDLNLGAQLNDINLVAGVSIFIECASDFEIVTTGNSGDILIQASRDAAALSAAIAISNEDTLNWGTGNTDVVIGAKGDLVFSNLRTTLPTQPGAIWNDSGTIKIV